MMRAGNSSLFHPLSHMRNRTTAAKRPLIAALSLHSANRNIGADMTSQIIANPPAAARPDCGRLNSRVATQVFTAARVAITRIRTAKDVRFWLKSAANATRTSTIRSMSARPKNINALNRSRLSCTLVTATSAPSLPRLPNSLRKSNTPSAQLRISKSITKGLSTNPFFTLTKNDCSNISSTPGISSIVLMVSPGGSE